MSTAPTALPRAPTVAADDVDERFAALVADLEDELLDAELDALAAGLRRGPPTAPDPAGPSPRGGPAANTTTPVGTGPPRRRHPDAGDRSRQRSPPQRDHDRA